MGVLRVCPGKDPGPGGVNHGAVRCRGAKWIKRAPACCRRPVLYMLQAVFKKHPHRERLFMIANVIDVGYTGIRHIFC